jgi:hypothetical protein
MVTGIGFKKMLHKKMLHKKMLHKKMLHKKMLHKKMLHKKNKITNLLSLESHKNKQKN